MDLRTGAVVAGAGGLALGIVYLMTRAGGSGCPAGQVAIQLIAQGPGTVSAGGAAQTRGTLTVCPHVGDQVQYQAIPDQGHSFVRFEGPGGVQTQQNPFTAVTQGSAGFVRGIFQ